MNPVLGGITAVLSLIVELMENLTVKSYSRYSEKGYLIDVIIDRLSEGVMLIKFFNPWFYLFVINSVLAITSFNKNRKSSSLPLRPLFVTFYLLQYVV